MINMINEITSKAIKDALIQLGIHPLLHFSEKSIQVSLASKLLCSKEVSTPVETSIYNRFEKRIGKLWASEKDLSNALSVTPLQMEYWNNEKWKAYRIDIAILNPDDIKKIDSWQFQSQWRYLDPLVWIEIWSEKSWWNEMSGKHLENDAFKLSTSKHAYILNIMRNTNVSQKWSKGYERKSSQMNSFKESMKKKSLKYPNINWVWLILHVAYKEVELLCKDNEWKFFKIPSKDYEKAVNDKLWIKWS